MKNHKLVSVILCCHKVNSFLFKSIDSILHQDYSKFELIILFDNPSSFEFKKIKTRYKNHILFNKIIFLKNRKNIGLTKSLNIAINKSNGDYIMRQDSDDISKKNRISSFVNYLNNNKDKSLVFCNVEIINEKNIVIKKKLNYLISFNFYNSYDYRNSIAHPSIMFTKKIYKKVKGYDERFKYSQDYEFISQVLEINNNSVGKIHSRLYQLRYQKNSISVNFGLFQRQNSVIIILKKKYLIFKRRFVDMDSSQEMIDYISINLINNHQKSIFFGYLFEKKIPLSLMINPLFLINLIFLYVNHPNLFLKRMIMR